MLKKQQNTAKTLRYIMFGQFARTESAKNAEMQKCIVQCIVFIRIFGLGLEKVSRGRTNYDNKLEKM